LLIGGALELVAAFSRGQQGRLAIGLLGVVGVLAGIIVLAWPQPSVRTFAVVAGVSLVAIGTVQLLRVRNAMSYVRTLDTR